MIILLLSLLQSAQAVCLFETSQNPIHMGGSFIDYEPYLEQEMDKKGYQFLESGMGADHMVDVSLNVYAKGSFEHVACKVELLDKDATVKAARTADVTCVGTQLCANQNGVKAVKKAIDLFVKDLPVCKQ